MAALYCARQRLLEELSYGHAQSDYRRQLDRRRATQKEVLDRLRVSKGDVLYVIETPNGVELTPYDPEFAQQIAVAEQVMRASDRNVLRKLAER